MDFDAEDIDPDSEMPGAEAAGTAEGTETAESVEAGDADVNFNDGLGWLRRLNNDSPNPDLEDITGTDILDLENGGWRRMMRGIYKFGGWENPPAWWDLFAGAVEEGYKRFGDRFGGGGENGGGVVVIEEGQ